MTTETPPSGSVSIGRAVAHPPAGRAAALTFAGDGGARINVPYEPAAVSFSQPTVWIEQPRAGAGNQGELLHGPGQLAVVTFTLTIGYRNNRSIEPILNALRAAARGAQRWSVSFLPLGTGLWRFTTCDLEADDWNELAQVTRANANLGLTEAGAASSVGPATGGLASLAIQPRPPTYTVHAGETLTTVAIRFYGEARYIWAIAQANNLRNWNVHPGQVLKLPKPV